MRIECPLSTTLEPLAFVWTVELSMKDRCAPPEEEIRETRCLTVGVVDMVELGWRRRETKGRKRREMVGVGSQGAKRRGVQPFRRLGIKDVDILQRYKLHKLEARSSKKVLRKVNCENLLSGKVREERKATPRFS